jgi:alpha-L-fucosidase 2
MNESSIQKVPHLWWVASLLVHALTAPAADLAERAPAPPTRDRVLWYRQPAGKWLEAMPLGNGLMGAMVFGGIQSERIALNESTFWSGRPHDYDNPDAFKHFAQIRDLVFAGKFQEAEKMADAHFYGRPAAQQAYQPLGDLLKDISVTGRCSGSPSSPHGSGASARACTHGLRRRCG